MDQARELFVIHNKCSTIVTTVEQTEGMQYKTQWEKKKLLTFKDIVKLPKYIIDNDQFETQ